MTRIHISIPVADLEQSVGFYSRFLGHAPSKLKGDYANFRLDSPPLHLALTPKAGPSEATGDLHFGVEVADAPALEAWRSRMDPAGLIESTEEGTTCCYAVANKVWTRDPDGNSWEVWHRLEDAETRNAPAASDCGADTACCG